VHTDISKALAALPELVVVLDGAGTVVAAVGTVAWLSSDTLPGRAFEELISDQDPLRLIGVIEVLADLQGGNVTVLAISEDGSQSVPCMMTGAPLEGDHWIVAMRATTDMQREMAEQARHAAGEREKADALEVARRELEETNAELHRMQADLVKASRIAGMAEVATSVLHNVGNVLNGLNVGVTVVRRALHDRPGARIERAVKLIEELCETPNVDKLRQVATYLRKLSGVLDEQLHRIDGEVALLGEKVDHVNSIVCAQQQHAKPAGVCEAVDVRELLRESIRLHTASMATHGIDVAIECDEGVTVVVDRHKVLQILVNLIGNAKDAMKHSSARVLTLSGACEGEMLAIACHDTGVGMDAATLGKLFTHGFTTKPSGHGFGLHASVNSAREMGGDLRGSSDGIGCGACFTLTVPREPRVSRKAA
jgi:C4-dicarboxylate-specific signal transduction histidine kinase